MADPGMWQARNVAGVSDDIHRHYSFRLGIKIAPGWELVEWECFLSGASALPLLFGLNSGQHLL